MILDQVVTDRYAIYNGDCMEILKEMGSESIALSIYSPPFCRALPLFFVRARPFQLQGLCGIFPAL
jgi:hypothetical protein